MKILGKELEVLFDMAGCPRDLISCAKESFAKAKKVNRKAMPYQLSAPIVMAWVCPQLEWEAEHLPHRYRYWDNEVSINGDRANWYFDEAEKAWKRHPIPYDKGNGLNFYGKPYNYYAPKKLSPRHWFARYIWLGWRNRAAAYYAQFGVQEPTPDKIKEIQKWEYATEKERIEIYHYNGSMQLIYHRKYGAFHVRANMGYKLSNVNEITGKARPVYTPFSFKIRPNRPL